MFPNSLRVFAKNNTLTIRKQIGFGIHGEVFEVSLGDSPFPSVVKVFGDEAAYSREKAVYERLLEHSVTEVLDCCVPEFLGADDELLVIWMTYVTRPFCLDFASAYLDELPAYFPEFDQQWHEDKANQFGPSDWPKVLSVLSELESLGIFQTDVSPSNICVGTVPP